jgi:hypothetical protein
MGSRARRLLPRIAFAIGTGLLVLALVAVGLELWAKGRVERVSDLWVASERLNHLNRPSSVRHSKDFLPKDPDWPEPFDERINAQGWFRDGDVSLTKPPGTWRIFYVGDSFTESPVPPDQAIPTVVERYIGERLQKSGFNVEVINAGCWSYSPTIYYINIRYFLKPFSPDAIVLNVDLTDDFDDWKYSFSTVTDAEGLPWAVLPARGNVPRFVTSERGALRAGWLADVQLFLYRKSYFFNWLARRGETPRTLAEPKIPTEELYQPWSWCREDWDPVTAKNAGRTLALVGEIARYCKREGIRLAITGVPHWEQFSGKDGKPAWSTRPLRELERVARENGVGWFDSYGPLEPELRGSPQRQFYYLDDMHFNPRGNALWADVHKRAVCDPKLGLLPDGAYGFLSR